MLKLISLLESFNFAESKTFNMILTKNFIKHLDSVWKSTMFRMKEKKERTKIARFPKIEEWSFLS